MRKNDISNMELVKEYPWLQIKDSSAILLDLLPNGWRWLIIDMCRKIAHILDWYDIDRSEYKVTDAKEKWGGLSWFSWLGDLDSIDNEIEGIDDATFRYVQALITNIEREYEYTSGNICMICGRYKLRDKMVCKECENRI